jgi:putative zinc finger/helix-turn-helix YgiT family protein
MNSKVEPYRYTESGLNVTLLGIEVLTCPSCGERMPRIPAPKKLHETLVRVVVKRPSRLAPEEIRFLRTYLGRSKVDFAKLIGVSREQVSRWETGNAAIGASADRLIRTLAVYTAPEREYGIESLSSTLEKISNEQTPSTMIQISRGKDGWQQLNAA